MITTNTTPARAAIGATVAAICFAVVACGSEQGTVPDRNRQPAAQHAAADDVAALVEYRKAALTQHMGRPQHAVADDVAAQVEYRKAALTQAMSRPQHAVADDVERLVEQRKSAHRTR